MKAMKHMKAIGIWSSRNEGDIENMKLPDFGMSCWFRDNIDFPLKLAGIDAMVLVSEYAAISSSSKCLY